jgi:hypothetical protein
MKRLNYGKAKEFSLGVMMDLRSIEIKLFITGYWILFKKHTYMF